MRSSSRQNEFDYNKKEASKFLTYSLSRSIKRSRTFNPPSSILGKENPKTLFSQTRRVALINRSPRIPVKRYSLQRYKNSQVWDGRGCPFFPRSDIRTVTTKLHEENSRGSFSTFRGKLVEKKEGGGNSRKR